MRVHIPQDHAMQPQAYMATAYAPTIVASAFEFSKVTYEHSGLPLRVFEAARARTAQINGCIICQSWRSNRHAAGYLKSMGGSGESVATRGGPAPDEAFYDAILEWRTSPLFSERERVAIEYAEGLGLNPHGLAEDEAFWARANKAFSDDELIDLSYCIACWMALGRVAHVLGVDDVCQLPSPEPQTVTA